MHFTIVCCVLSVRCSKREPADFTIERCCLFLPLAYDCLVSFSLKVHDETTPSFKGGVDSGVNINVEIGCCEWRSHSSVSRKNSDVSGHSRNAWLPNADLFAEVKMWARPILLFRFELDVAVAIKQRAGEAFEMVIPVPIVNIEGMGGSNIPHLVKISTVCTFLHESSLTEHIVYTLTDIQYYHIRDLTLMAYSV